MLNKYNQLKFEKKAIAGFTSVIVPVYKDYKGLTDTLTSLSTQTLSHDRYEIIVANDGADIKISEVCSIFHVQEVLINPSKGSYNARNKSLEKSSGEYLAFTDADVVVSRNWLKTGQLHLQEKDYVVGPVSFIKKENYTLTEQYGLLYEFNIKKFFDNDHFGVTANLFIKRTVLTEIGGFDSRLKSGGDKEFGTRVHMTEKYSMIYTPLLKVVHPFRNYNEIIVKKNRVASGSKDLIQLYPTIYQHTQPVLIDEIYKLLSPPLEHISNIKFFFFVWWQKCIDFYVNIRVFKPKQIIHHNNRLTKFANSINKKKNIINN